MQFEDGSVATPIPSAPALAGIQPAGNFVRDACFLAVRCADRGDPANARNNVKKALIQLAMIGDPAVKAYWQREVDQTTAYVEAKAGEAQSLAVAAQFADDQYKLGQKLSPEERQALVDDNADTQAAEDAEANGENVALAYNKKFVGRVVLSGVGQVSEAAAQGAGAALGPWKWALLIGALVLVVVAGGYAYAVTRTVGKVAA